MVNEKTKIIRRLKKIEGQVRGIQRMMENESCCSDVLTQVAAIKAAINKVGILVFEHHAHNCFTSDSEDEKKANLDELMKMISMFYR